jgi:hypothetical protein
MKTDKTEQIFLVLVPHRDTRLVLRNYGAELAKAGVTWAFPMVAPLAVLSRPLNTGELKNIARSFRKTDDGTKFSTKEAYAAPFPFGKEKRCFLFGPRLDFTVPPDFLSDTGEPFFPVVIGACLLSGEKENTLPRPPPLSFSAAAVANMFWERVDLSPGAADGYKWKIGKLCWLPKKAERDLSANQKRAEPG